MILGSAVTGMDAKNACRIYLRDRKKHKSPNAAQTESVMAGALGVKPRRRRSEIPIAFVLITHHRIHRIHSFIGEPQNRAPKRHIKHRRRHPVRGIMNSILQMMLPPVIGFVLDLMLGDPGWLYHPVRLIGHLITGA